jgi:hypothetical protein
MMFKKIALGLTLVAASPLATAFAAETQENIEAAAAVDGFSVSFVQYPSGNFSKGSDGTWVERSSNAIIRFAETGRDQWSVYLQEIGSNKLIALDLWTLKVKISYGPHEAYRPLYEITYAR